MTRAMVLLFADREALKGIHSQRDRRPQVVHRRPPRRIAGLAAAIAILALSLAVLLAPDSEPIGPAGAAQAQGLRETSLAFEPNRGRIPGGGVDFVTTRRSAD